MEVWDLVDGKRRAIGKLHTRGEAQQPGEVCGAKFVILSELEEMVQQGLIVPRIWDRFQLNRSRIMPYLNPEKLKEAMG